MICAQTRPPPLQTPPALVTRPERLTLKSRQDTFSEHYWARKGDEYYDCDRAQVKSIGVQAIPRSIVQIMYA